MKKIALILTAIISLTVILASCGTLTEAFKAGFEEGYDKVTTEPAVDETTEPAVDETAEPAADETIEPAADETEANFVAEKEPVAAEEEAPQYVRGTIEDGIYTSQWLGLRFEPADSLVMATDEELASTMGVAIDVLNQPKEYMELALSYEMMAVDYMSGSSVNVLVEKLALSNMTLEQYVEAAESQLKSVGYIDGELEYDYVEFCGETYMTYEYKMYIGEGLPEITTAQFIRKIDDRIAIITFGFFSEDAFEMLLDCFSEY